MIVTEYWSPLSIVPTIYSEEGKEKKNKEKE